MTMMRIVAVLVLAALVLIVAYFVTRKRQYLTWAWWTFVAALVCMFAVMLFYFFERLFLVA